MNNKGTPFTQNDLNRICDDLATLPYFPKDSRASVMIELAAMCPHLEALEWLGKQVRTKLTTWPGLKEIRGILCWKYDAADGEDAYSSLPGFSPIDGEAKSYETHRQLKDAGGWEQDVEALKNLRQLPAPQPTKGTL